MQLPALLIAGLAGMAALLPAAAPAAPPAMAAPAPAAWKSTLRWRDLRPLETLPRGQWWRVYDDPALHRLVAAATSGNQDLRKAVARFDQARATARVARSRFFPDINASPSALYQRTSENMASPFPLIGLSYEGWNLNAPLDLSYEVDLWGRVRRQFEAARADAAAAAAAMESALLSIQAETAQNTFRLRAIDREAAAIGNIIAAWREELEIVRARIRAGAGSDLEEQQALSDLAAAEAEAEALAAQRAELENALAVLTGLPAPEFAVARSTALPPVPAIPPGLPSDLLERRPDIARAERALSAAAARFGVASTALFPSLRLAGNGGFMGTDFSNLFESISRQWSIGPSVSLPLFAGGRNRAALEQARAVHEEALAAYRQAVLVAFADVESQLAALSRLAAQEEAIRRSLGHALKGAEIARTRHKAGTSPWLEVLVANRSVLALERRVAQVSGQRLIASVALIKALGGGWNQSLPVVVPVQTPDPASLPPAKPPLLKRLFRRPANASAP